MEIVLDDPLDMHLHLREGAMLAQVAPFSAAQFAGAVIMPNLVDPVDTLAKLQHYRDTIITIINDPSFFPYMTLFFRPYSRQELLEAKDHCLGIKLYPAGITTQSEKGVSDFDAIAPTIEFMEQLGIPLLVHGESSGFVLEREYEFIEIYRHLAETFPKLHIIMEHITTAASIEFLDRYENVSATVTLHHLVLTLDDLLGDLMRPDLFCKPVAKTPKDRQALQAAVFSGHPRIMFGSDSAPHPHDKKECYGCAAGVFSAPVALPMLVQLFDEYDCLEHLQPFVSTNACTRYGIVPPAKKIRLVDRSWRVNQSCAGVRPFLAGQDLRWSVGGHG